MIAVDSCLKKVENEHTTSSKFSHDKSSSADLSSNQNFEEHMSSFIVSELNAKNEHTKSSKCTHDKSSSAEIRSHQNLEEKIIESPEVKNVFLQRNHIPAPKRMGCGLISRQTPSCSSNWRFGRSSVGTFPLPVQRAKNIT